MSRKYVLAAGAAALGAAAAGRGQRSRRIWLGMQGLPAQGRRVGDAVSARELVLTSVSDGTLYPWRQRIEANLRKKMAKGQFDPAKAPQAYSRWLETAAKQYNARFGSPGVPWHQVFDAPTRRLAAQEMVDDFIAEEGVQGRGGRRAAGRRAGDPSPGWKYNEGEGRWQPVQRRAPAAGSEEVRAVRKKFPRGSTLYVTMSGTTIRIYQCGEKRYRSPRSHDIEDYTHLFKQAVESVGRDYPTTVVTKRGAGFSIRGGRASSVVYALGQIVWGDPYAFHIEHIGGR